MSAARVALVTGAGRGLGAVIAARFHAAGYRVALTDIDDKAAAERAEELDATGATAVGVALDIRHKTAFEAARDTLLERWGQVDVLVNNAARTCAEPVLEIAPDSFSDVIGTNLNGTFYGCQVFGTYFAGRGTGRIINLASLAAQNGGTATGAHYAASKGGISTLTKVFARELASRGVTVNAISPGPQDLPVVREVVPPDKLDALIAGIPVQRLGAPEFIADMAVLLAAEHATGVTGACWDANGGLYMR